ncbi:alpha/beta hydrolase [Neorhodopirellula pilleata]|uniref:alpha/beta hydrolase n=1 Tax=Neorhodopirellula pilleata TaxID=2714738 RepID=UPI0018CCBD0B|nr:alpha/beta hydrolase [Neorhodopirellula pilleata]
MRENHVYAKVANGSLSLDFYPPLRGGDFQSPGFGELATESRHHEGGNPTIVWVHGGAWRAGSKSDVPVLHWLERGFAIASVDYRLSTEAKFPAQVHDIKAAIRYLRGHASELNLDPNRFVIAGSSAGGHLAALVGVSGGVEELEGSIGDHVSESSDVQAIVSFYGASNLQSILSQSTEHGLRVRVPALQLLLGGQPDEVPELAKLASPVAHVDISDPPLWLIHGDADPQMPPQQSEELRAAYEKLSLPVELDVVAGGKHGGEEFFSKERLGRLATVLRQRGTAVPAVKEQLHGGDHRATLKMLFAGSSSTYWNDMPNEIAKVISGKGGLMQRKTVTADLVGRSGSDIRVYLDPDCDYQYGVKPGQSFLDKVRDEPLDYVVLMTVCRFIMGDGDGNPDGQGHRDAITQYCREIRASGAEPVFYEMGWGTTDREAEGRKRLMNLARENNIKIYVPCSTAWAKVRSERPDLKLQHAKDKSHPGDLGHFLNMACFYAAFVQQSPVAQIPRTFHVWPHLDKAEKESLEDQLDASFESFQPDAYQARLPEWMRRNAGAGYVGKVSDQDAAYLESVAWDTWLETQESLR